MVWFVRLVIFIIGIWEKEAKKKKKARMATMVSSAGALLAMLSENHPSLKLHALSNLNAFAQFLWPEISTSIPLM